MGELLSLENFVTLGLLTLLQAVLGFDNLLYISLESKRAPAAKQAMVRRLGIGIAIIARISLLFVLINLVRFFQAPFFGVHADGLVEGEFNGHSVIVLLGGVFILYTATKEIFRGYPLDAGIGCSVSCVPWVTVAGFLWGFVSLWQWNCWPLRGA